MDTGQLISIYSRLILGGFATFLAIILWAKTRDIAWMLIILSTITMYIEIITSILEKLGIVGNYLAILLPVLRIVFLIAAFTVMIVKQYRVRK